MSFIDSLADELRALRERKLLRQERVITSAQGPRVVVDRREFLCFCSNNYLGLASAAELTSSAQKPDEKGLGAGASRLITGTMTAHRALEAAFARWVGKEDAVFFSTGYAANVGAVAALVGKDDVIFSDTLNHASLIDGCRLSRAQTHVYTHCDLADLERLLAAHRAPARRALVVTEAYFSMDGDVAPLRALRDLCDRYSAALYVDEAHSIGVFGPTGAGICAQEQVHADFLLGTLGKAVGCAGAVLACDSIAADYLRNRARSYVFSTAPAVALTQSALQAIELTQRADEARMRLHAHAKHLRTALRQQGWNIPASEGPIIPVVIGDAEQTMNVFGKLFELGVWVQGIRPPTVPQGSSRLRLVPMATHSDRDIETAIHAFEKTRASL